MSQAVRESLSALLDNEATELDIQRILKAMEHDPEIARVWERYCLGQSLIHDPAVYRAAPDLAGRVSDALRHEAVPAGSSLLTGRQVLVKLAIAASVAVVVFAGMQFSLQQDAVPVASQVTQPATEAPAGLNEASGISPTLVADVPTSEVDPLARQRLEDYIRSVSIAPEEPPQLQNVQDSPLFRLVNEIRQQTDQATGN